MFHMLQTKNKVRSTSEINWHTTGTCVINPLTTNWKKKETGDTKTINSCSGKNVVKVFTAKIFTSYMVRKGVDSSVKVIA